MKRSAEERRDFVLAQTRLAAVPGLEGVLLWTADAAFPLWHEAADWLKRGELALPFWAFPWAGGVGLAPHLQR
ncbi:MAG: methyltransferase, partial [Deltaproteobacteria bacterium]|nr:methyltransferase [Deltaproteobacteria bacterium]